MNIAKLADIIDKEASIAIRKMAAGRQFVLNITVKKRDPQLVLELQNGFGGGIYKERMRKNSDSYRHVWKIYSSKAIAVLNQVLPFLIRNEEQAKLALQFSNISIKKGTKLTIDEIKMREDYMVKIKSLNIQRNGTP